MKRKVVYIVIFVISALLMQGCYTILDLPDYYSSGNTSTSYDNSGSVIVIDNPVDIIIPQPIVTVSQPTNQDQNTNTDIYKYRSIDQSNNNSDSNSRNSSSNSSSSGRGSSDVRNSGNGRR